MNKPITTFQEDDLAQLSNSLHQPGGQAALVWRTVLITILLLMLLLSYNKTFGQTVSCTMVFSNRLNISVGKECMVTIRYDQNNENIDKQVIKIGLPINNIATFGGSTKGS